MSKLDELINELCPNGVEFQPLNNKSLFYFHYGIGNKIPEDTGGKYDVYGANGVVSHIDEYNCEDVSIIGHIGAVGFVNRCKGKCFVTYNGTICEVVDKNKVNTQYLYYVLTTLNLPSYHKGSQPFLSVSDFERIEIPVPPLPIQEEIVGILDNFTELTAELTAELQDRKKQYEYYRDSLLTFNNDVKVIRIKDYFKRIKGTPITAEKMKEIESVDGDVKIFAGGKTQIFAFENDIPNANITRVPAVLVQSRGLIDFVYYDQPFTFKNEMWAYTCDNVITLKYLYHYFKNNIDYFRNSSSGMGAMPQISLAVTEDFKIYLPVLEIQERIVNVLDNFEKICNDLKIGLPAEIELRQKQYEYYRDMLLTFPENDLCLSKQASKQAKL